MISVPHTHSGRVKPECIAEYIVIYHVSLRDTVDTEVHFNMMKNFYCKANNLVLSAIFSLHYKGNDFTAL
jgi:hypothetical protein